MAAQSSTIPLLDKGATMTGSLTEKLSSTAAEQLKPLTAAASSSFPWIKYLIIFLIVSVLLFLLALYIVKRYFNIDLSSLLSLVAAIPKTKAGDTVKSNDAKGTNAKGANAKGADAKTKGADANAKGAKAKDGVIHTPGLKR
jgi:hypothetical protein